MARPARRRLAQEGSSRDSLTGEGAVVLMGGWVCQCAGLVAVELIEVLFFGSFRWWVGRTITESWGW